MKTLVSILIAFCCLQHLSAQKMESRAYNKGSSTISAGYGFINVWESLFREFIEETSSTGPFTLSYEYGITNRISGGVLVGYSIATGTYHTTSSKYEMKIKNISALLIANYHFGKFKKWDPYVGANFGYYGFNYSQTNSNITIPPEVIYTKIPASVGFAGQAGVKYYFTPHFAAFFEAGYVSAAIIHVGITAKL